MTDKNNRRLQEEREDAALGLLMEEYAEIEGEALWQAFWATEAAENQPNAPAREDRKWSRGSKDTNRRYHFLKRIGNGGKRAAVILLVLFCLLSPLVLSVEAFKVPVLNYIVALEQKFSGFSFSSNEHSLNDQEEVIQLIQLAPCPNGYQLSKQLIGPYGRIWIDFECDGRNIMKISIYPSNGQINVDTEDASQVSMIIHDYEAVYLQKDGHRLMWMDGERELIFDLYASELEKDDFWRYAYILTEALSQ